MIGAFPTNKFLDLHRRLATTPGPSLAEEPRRHVLQNVLDQAGLHTRTDRGGNLWVQVMESGPWEETLVIDAHIDVVERGYVDEVRHDGDVLQGLGVGDNLAAVTMLALALMRLAQGNRQGQRPLTALFSVGEEGLGNLQGVKQAVADHPSPPYCFVALDGSLGTFSMTGLGSRRYRAGIRCPGGHSWGDFGSPNAIEILTEILHEIKTAYSQLAASAAHPVSFNIGTISGGEGINSIARSADATYEFRSPSAALLEEMDSRLGRILAATGSRASVESRHEIIGTRPAASAVRPERVRGCIEPAWGPALGALEDTPMSTNVNVPLAAGWPAACVGVCRYSSSHTENEKLDLTSLPTGWHCLDRLLEQQVWPGSRGGNQPGTAAATQD